MDRLTSLTAFVRVADSGGFSAAGRKLNMSTTMVSNHVQSLEDRLGVRLLNRTTRKVSLTEVGQSYYDRCIQILADIEQADDIAGALQSAPRGTLRIYTATHIVQFVAPVVTEFLAQYPPAATLVYLPDMARLEWALNNAWHAPDTPALTPAELTQAAETMTTLQLHPACRLLASPWPIEKIWRANQSDDGTDVTIDLGEDGSRLLIYRQEFDVALAAISLGEFVMLSRLAHGANLESAVTDALASEPSFEVATALAATVTRGCLTSLPLEAAAED